MPMQIMPPPSETIREITEAISAAIPDSEVEVNGGGGRFAVRVVAQAFASKRTLEQQRMVYSAIEHLMKGEGAPVHAIDHMETLTPDPS